MIRRIAITALFASAAVGLWAGTGSTVAPPGPQPPPPAWFDAGTGEVLHDRLPAQVTVLDCEGKPAGTLTNAFDGAEWLPCGGQISTAEEDRS